MSPAHAGPGRDERESATGPHEGSELTWLLHRAAQRLNAATGEQAERHGLAMRDYILLSALDKSPGLSQAELGRVIGADKTTLMAQLDRLVDVGLVERLLDPHDRRVRRPALTAAGESLRATIAADADTVERKVLAGFDANRERALRRMLIDLIGVARDR